MNQLLRGAGLFAVAAVAGVTAPSFPVSAATISLSTGQSCTYTSFTGTAGGNFSFTCESTGGGGNPTPACNAGQFSATAGTPAALPLTCNSATTGATWAFTGGPAQVAISGTAPSVTFPSAGTYSYNVTPEPGGTAVGVSITVAAAGGTPPGGGSSGSTVLCTQYPGGYRGKLDYSFGTSSLSNFQDWYTLTANQQGYAPMVSLRLFWPAARGTTSKGSINVAESPQFATLSYKYAVISETPCDLTGSTVKWSSQGTSPKITYTVEANEGFLFGSGWFATMKTGIKLQAGKAYYLNIVSGQPGDPNTSSCPAGNNCGIVLDIWQPQ